ncbi:hypothetical protein GJ744_008984 [Endocarpon pusillum]|uniref:Uncharacterized protein n=1 Tax=Endocarpon pusillum TaxID=364733 RepID=A0A8H7E465_9EURO|nr:hypothetical protein GJ744_008984 [Endocarpon pusillum]
MVYYIEPFWTSSTSPLVQLADKSVIALHSHNQSSVKPVPQTLDEEPYYSSQKAYIMD